MKKLTQFFIEALDRDELYTEGFFTKTSFEKDLKKYGIKRNFFDTKKDMVVVRKDGNFEGLRLVAAKNGLEFTTSFSFARDFVDKQKYEIDKQLRTQKDRGFKEDIKILDGTYRIKKLSHNVYTADKNNQQIGVERDLDGVLQDVYLDYMNTKNKKDSDRVKHMIEDDVYVITSIDPDNKGNEDFAIATFYGNNSDDEEMVARVNKYAKKHKLTTYNFRKATKDEIHFIPMIPNDPI